MSHAQISFVMIVSTVVCPGHDAYRNLVVPNITNATQSSTYGENGANRTVDGQPSKLGIFDGSCSHTVAGQGEAWLRIYLDKVYNVKEVKFWYRDEGRGDLIETLSLHYYALFFVNPVNNSWISCYRDETPFNQPIPMPSTVSCKSKTAVIQFYTTKPSPRDTPQVFLEICEVEVYGCNVNQYGEDCTNCSQRCTECDVVSGCVSCYQQFTGTNCELCQPGYMGDTCESPCTCGWYGQNCSRECSLHCLDNSTCTPVNGVCPQGFNPGFKGSTCMKECNTGTYGIRCERQCSGNCHGNQTCNSVTGYCESGCSRGWEGPKCLKSAGQKNYGFHVDGRKNVGFYVAISILAILLVISVSVNIHMMRRKIEARNIRHTENTQTPKRTISENYDNPTEVTDSKNYDNPTEVTESTNYDNPTEVTDSKNYDNPTEVTDSTNYDNPTEVTDSTNYEMISFSGEKSEYTALETLQQKSH